MHHGEVIAGGDILARQYRIAELFRFSRHITAAEVMPEQAFSVTDPGQCRAQIEPPGGVSTGGDVFGNFRLAQSPTGAGIKRAFGAVRGIGAALDLRAPRRRQRRGGEFAVRGSICVYEI